MEHSLLVFAKIICYFNDWPPLRPNPFLISLWFKLDY